MMQQKIVMKMHMHCDKCRNKALKIAADVQGEYHACQFPLRFKNNISNLCVSIYIEKKRTNCDKPKTWQVLLRCRWMGMTMIVWW